MQFQIPPLVLTTIQRILTQISTGICQETVVLNEPSCVAQVDLEVPTNGTLASTGDAVDDFFDNVRNSFSPEILFAIWIIISFAVGYLVHTQFKDNMGDSHKFTLVAIYFTLVIGIFMRFVPLFFGLLLILVGVFGIASFLYSKSGFMSPNGGNGGGEAS